MSKTEAVFDPRKLSVKGVERELEKRPELSVAELKALLRREATGGRPRHGVEKAVDERLAALAERALEAVAEDMHRVVDVKVMDEGHTRTGMAVPADPATLVLKVVETTVGPEEPVVEVEGPEVVEQPLAEVVEEWTAAEVAAEAGPATTGVANTTVNEEPEPEPEPSPIVVLEPGEILVSPVLPLESKPELHGPTHNVFLKEVGSRSPVPAEFEPGPIGTTVPGSIVEVGVAPEFVAKPATPIAKGDEVHVRMLDGMVHEGHFVERAEGAMVRLRDGRDTLLFVPNARWWLSPKPKS